MCLHRQAPSDHKAGYLATQDSTIGVKRVREEVDAAQTEQPEHKKLKSESLYNNLIIYFIMLPSRAID